MHMYIYEYEHIYTHARIHERCTARLPIPPSPPVLSFWALASATAVEPWGRKPPGGTKYPATRARLSCTWRLCPTKGGLL
eukprot:5538405-Alexandrium_andersonii.AAC.1